MSEKTCKTVRLYYGIALGAMSVILGALLMWQVLDNYFTGVLPGEKFIFSQSGLAARFVRVSPAFWIWLIMVIGGFVIWEVFPVAAKRTAYKDPLYNLARLKKRIPETVGAELQESMNIIKREERIIKILWLCCAALGLAGVIYSIVYLATPSHYPDINVSYEVLNTAKNILPWALAVFAVASGITIYEYVSAKKTTAHAKKLAAGNKPKEVKHGKLYAVISHKYFKPAIRIAVGLVVLALFIWAFIDGENIMNILDKAIKICSECIGLG